MLKAKRIALTVNARARMVLDVGCGLNPKGDVNIDNDRGIPKQKLIPNFILADAENLPFRDKCFSLGHASHIPEHILDPIKAFEEWKRVAKVVEIYTPSALNLDKTKGHIYTWNVHTLRNILCLVFKNVSVDYTSKPSIVSGRLARYLPLLNIFLAKLGFRRELKALCGD